MPPAPPVIDDRPLSADRVPTLTEVVELNLPAKAPADADRLGDEAALGEGAAAKPVLDLPSEVDLADAFAAPAADVAADPVTPAMADDFVLTGLEAEEVFAAPVEPDTEAQVATAAEALAQEASVDVPGVDPSGSAVAAPPVERPAPPPAIDVDAVVGQVLSELMPRIDMLLESRLREALAPALARAADGLIRDTRANLSVAVRDLVQEAVDRALQRRADE